MTTTALVLAIVVIALVALAAGRDGPDQPAAAPTTRRPKLPTHGNSALAGGYIDAGQVCFYAPTPCLLYTSPSPRD